MPDNVITSQSDDTSVLLDLKYNKTLNVISAVSLY